MFHHHTLLSLVCFAPALAAQSTFGNGNPRDIVTPPSSATTFFVGALSKTQAGLYLTNGTVNGAVLLKTWTVGPGRSGPSDVTAVGSSRVYFVADDGVNGRELWTSDGTTPGTVMVADIRLGASSSHPQQLTAITIPPGPLAGEHVLFTADNGADGRELWLGNTAGVVTIANRPGAAALDPEELTVAAGARLYFSADDGVSGRELWVVDFAALGSGILDLAPGAASSSPFGITALGGSVVFSANNGVTGYEPWRCDVSGFGVLTITPTALGNLASGAASSLPSDFTVVASTIFFTADNGTIGNELWRSDGTPGGTQLALDIRTGAAGSNPRNLTAGTTSLWFVANDGTRGDELWRAPIAGTPVLVADIVPGAIGSSPQDLVPFQTSELLFTANDATSGRELWRATLAGATQVIDLASGLCDGRISNLRAFGLSTVYFAAEVGDGSGQELYRTNGTGGGTLRLEDTFPGPDQGTLDLHHLEQSGNLDTEFRTCATVPNGIGAVLLAVGPGPEVNLQPFFAQTVLGTLDLSLVTFIPFSIPITTNAAGNATVQPVITVPETIPAFEIAAQVFTFNVTDIELSNNITLCKGTVDVSGCAACVGKNLVANEVHYTDDTFEYEVDCKMSGTTETWVTVVKVYTDLTESTLFEGPLKDELKVADSGVELQEGEFLELQIRCGDQEAICYVKCKIGC